VPIVAEEAAVETVMSVDTKSAQTGASFPGIVDLSGWWVLTPTRVGTRARVH
jgi:hypothetical protein